MAQTVAKSEKFAKKEVKLDGKDKMIVNMLNKNGRTTLKEMSREVKMSIDAVKDRMDKMVKNDIIKIIAIPDTSKFDLPLGVHVYIKLQNISDKNLNDFINHLKSHKKVIIVMSMIGDYDIFFVFLAKDTSDLNEIKNDIRKKFSNIILNWSETVTAELYKYEEYNL